ncbi:Zinc finger BED domain-containing protein 1 [Merluccius polli]|uniref:Zinc finger BED domain-containing protein 1 n=1 Tax=Merluccius polli TaxID=89951 RepID=A0AA47N853_MERPO|nr:Zinc finger BED domain-containing protein 1 [Merluccius polli]
MTPMMYHLNHAHPTLIAGSSSSSQPTITSVLARRSCDSQQADKITKGICKFIQTDMLPISIVEGEGFGNLMNIMEPAYNIPSRRTVTRLIETQYEERKEELFKKLATAESVALTTDCWTALTAESYITITCHYIGDLLPSAL